MTRTAEDSVHPDLKSLAPFLPRTAITRRTLRLARFLGKLRRSRPVAGVTIEVVSSGVQLRVYRPSNVESPGAALLWIHGGGMVIGRARDDDPIIGALARDLGIVIASVDYRLAPEFPYPAAVTDCYAGLKWLHEQPDIDPARIAIGGASAGGGLAASLAQYNHDQNEIGVAFQLLVYPMLDDRSAIRPGVDGRRFRLWNQKSNHFGWQAYLGHEPGSSAVDAAAVPARHTNLAGMPPAWIGVGTHDLFHDEDVEYAERLNAAGVPCQLSVVEGAFHGFDIVALRSPVANAFHAEWRRVLSEALGLSANVSTG